MNTEDLDSWLLVRNKQQLEDAVEAKRIILLRMKRDRDLRRAYECREYTLKNFPIKRGSYLSWGHGSYRHEYDEYFGEVDESKQPHGLGVKYYSDGTCYWGEFEHGLPHTRLSRPSTYTRPDGSCYEGEWLSGKKHGYGKFQYPENSSKRESYEGQWANNFPHGKGVLKYSDGSIYKGRFRFGIRDGPGVMIDAEGSTSKGNFKDKSNEAYVEIPPPKVNIDDNSNRVVYNPSSLLDIAVQSLVLSVLRLPHHQALHPLRLHDQFNLLANTPRFPHAEILRKLLAKEFYKSFRSLRSLTIKPSHFEALLSTGVFVFTSVEVPYCALTLYLLNTLKEYLFRRP